MKRISFFLLLLLIVSISTITEAQSPMRWGIKVGGLSSNSTISIKDFSPSINMGSRIGFYLGIVNNVPLSKSLDLQTELMYTNEGSKLSVGKDLISKCLGLTNEDEEGENKDISKYTKKDLSVSISNSYVKIPILLKYKTVEGLSIMAGPYFAYRIGLNLSSRNLENLMDEEEKLTFNIVKTLAENIIKDNTRKLDIGISLGTEYSLKNLFFDVRYNYSLTNSITDKIDLSSIGTEEVLEYKDEINLVKKMIEPRIRHHSLQLGIGYRF
jgi:hypothetical protein